MERRISCDCIFYNHEMPDVVSRIPPCHFLSFNIVKRASLLYVRVSNEFPTRPFCHIHSTCIVCVHTLVLFRLCTRPIQYTGQRCQRTQRNVTHESENGKRKIQKTEAQPKRIGAHGGEKLCMFGDSVCDGYTAYTYRHHPATREILYTDKRQIRQIVYR